MSPQGRVKFAWWVIVVSVTGWIGTHVAILVIDPPQNEWVFHLLLAISWIAITLTGVTLLITTQVRRDVDELEEENS